MAPATPRVSAPGHRLPFILDSQPVQTTERGGTRGFDGHKRVKGRKRHLLVDTLGMVVAQRVEAANVSDRRVGARLLAGLQSGFPSIRTVMADAGYESGKLACEPKRRHGWRLHITKRRRLFRERCPDPPVSCGGGESRWSVFRRTLVQSLEAV